MKRPDTLYFLLLLLLIGACGNEDESAQSKAITMLTDNSSKSWRIYEYYSDEQMNVMSACDSSYVLTMKSDFTWDELYTKIYCNQASNGHWLLNDENNVITITYTDQGSGQQVERKFEITELTEEKFTYQFAVRNVLKRIRMQVYD